jgi:hypothetical protein
VRGGRPVAGGTWGRDGSLGTVDVEFLFEVGEGVAVRECLHLFAEVLLADTDLDAVLLDRDVRFAVAVVAVHTWG